jgi:CspA family cold shock protein
MATGRIKKVVSDRGFGFITGDDGKDYFFHRTALSSALDFDRVTGGEAVQFELESSPRGPRATNVRPAAE